MTTMRFRQWNQREHLSEGAQHAGLAACSSASCASLDCSRKKEITYMVRERKVAPLSWIHQRPPGPPGSVFPRFPVREGVLPLLSFIAGLKIRSGAPPTIPDLLVVTVDVVLIDIQTQIGGREPAHRRKHLKPGEPQIALRPDQVDLRAEILELIIQQVRHQAKAKIILARRALHGDLRGPLLCLKGSNPALRRSVSLAKP